MAFYISRTYRYHQPRPQVGKWHIVFRREVFMPCPWKMTYEFGIYKIIQMPAEGEMLTPLHYQGFRFVHETYHPVEIYGAWNLPTIEEIKQRTLIWVTRILRSLASRFRR